MSPILKLCAASIVFVAAAASANATPFAGHAVNKPTFSRNTSNAPILFDRHPIVAKALRAPCVVGPKHVPCREIGLRLRQETSAMWKLNLRFMQLFLRIILSTACISAAIIAGAAPLTPFAEHLLKPKDSFKECDKCPEMVVVPAGRFIMGSARNEKSRDNNEGPAHLVRIKDQFAVGRFLITVDQFAAFVSETNYDAGAKCLSFDYRIGKWVDTPSLSWRNPGFSQDRNHPAVCLNWNDATAYVDWLARKTGKDYRLLSEAEWEYTARGQTKPARDPRYSFGDDEKDLCRYGNGADLRWQNVTGRTWPIAPCDDGYAFTSPVGTFEANNFGLFDMQGDAWQWTADCYRNNYTYIDSPLDGSAWIIKACRAHVIRGGSWGSIPSLLRAAARHSSATTSRYDNIGFRVARALAKSIK